MTNTSLLSRRVRVGSTLVLVGATLTAPSMAQPGPATPPPPAAHLPEPSQAQADALFTEGRDLLEKGMFPEACAKLARSEELAPAVGTLLNLAYCNEQVGKLRSAMDAYVEAERLANLAGESKRAAFAKERYAAVEPRATKLVVRVMAPEAPGLTIQRNGTPMTKDELGHATAVDPQDFVVTATAPGYLPWRGAFVVLGEGAVVTVIVPPLEDVNSVRSAPSGIVMGPQRLAAVGLGVLSAVTLGAGVGLGLTAGARYDDSSSHCANGCDDIGSGIRDGAKTQGNVAIGLVVLGVLSGGAAAYLWLASPPPPRSTALAPAIRVGVSPFGAALGGRF